MHKISQAHIVLAYEKPFITELFESSSYDIVEVTEAYCSACMA